MNKELQNIILNALKCSSNGRLNEYQIQMDKRAILFWEKDKEPTRSRKLYEEIPQRNNQISHNISLLLDEGKIKVVNDALDVMNMGKTYEITTMGYKEFEIKDPNSLRDMTDSELEDIVRMRENAGHPESRFSKAKEELEIRHRKKIEQSLNIPRTSIGIQSNGLNAKFIGNTFTEQGGILHQNINPRSTKKEWYEKPLGIIFITVVATIIAAGVVFYLHWN